MYLRPHSLVVQPCRKACCRASSTRCRTPSSPVRCGSSCFACSTPEDTPSAPVPEAACSPSPAPFHPPQAYGCRHSGSQRCPSPPCSSGSVAECAAPDGCQTNTVPAARAIRGPPEHRADRSRWRHHCLSADPQGSTDKYSDGNLWDPSADADCSTNEAKRGRSS